MESQHLHHHHHHTPGHRTSTGVLLGLAFWINLAFMLVEVIGGLVTNSLALLADAGHMFNDVLSLALTWGTYKLARRGAEGAYTYGYRRAQVLAALANAVSLGAIVLFILFESVRRLMVPQEIKSGIMLAVAVAGFAANLGSGALLFMRRNENMNIRGAFLHLLTDALGSVAAIAAALIIRYTGQLWVDPALSLALAALIISSVWGLMRESFRVLMEKAPEGYSPAKLTAALAAIEGVQNVHDLHVWQLDDGKPLATVHLVVRESSADHRLILERCQAVFREAINVEHATVQIEDMNWAPCGTDCR